MLQVMFQGVVDTLLPLVLCMLVIAAIYWRVWPQDFKERFCNYETLKGVYFFSAGVAMMYVIQVNERFAFRAGMLLIAWYFMCEGIRKIQVNRPKQLAERRSQVAKRLLDQ